MELFIKDIEQFEFDDIAEKAEFMIREELTYETETFVEHYFKNGLDLLEFVDSEKLLSDDEMVFPSISIFALITISDIRLKVGI